MKKTIALIITLLFMATHLMGAVTVDVNGSNYSIPETGEKGWGDSLTSWMQAISAATLHRDGGSFALTDEVDFGDSYGVLAPYVTSGTAASPSQSGVLRLGHNEEITWRNQTNSGDLGLKVQTDTLKFNGDQVITYAATQNMLNKTLTSPVLSTGVSGSAVYTDDTFASASGTTIPTSLAVKNYVDNNLPDLATHEADTSAHGVSGNIVGTSGAQSLYDKTLANPVINGQIIGTAILDDDSMATASNLTVPTSESVKEYVDAEILAQGSANLTLRSIGSTFTMSNSNEIVWVNGSSSYNITLPDAGSVETGSRIIFQRTDATYSSTIEIRTHSGDFFYRSGGPTTMYMRHPYESMSLINTGLYWAIAGRQYPNARQETKILGSDVTSDGNVSSISFTGLKIGNTYTIEGKFHWNIDSAGADTDCTAYISHNGYKYVSRVRLTGITDNSVDILTDGVSYKFVATVTSLTLSTGGVSANCFLAGNNTQEETWFTLREETNDQVQTTTAF